MGCEGACHAMASFLFLIHYGCVALSSRPAVYVLFDRPQAALLKRLVELTTAATHALSAAAAQQQQQREEQLGVAVALTTALLLAAGAFRCVHAFMTSWL